MKIVIYEVTSLPIEGCAKRRGDHLVVLVRPEVDDGRRRALLEELLTAEELRQFDAERGQA